MSDHDLDLILERSLIAKGALDAFHGFYRDVMDLAHLLAGVDGDPTARLVVLKLLSASKNLEARTGEFAVGEETDSDG